MSKRRGESGGILQRIRKASTDAPCPCGTGLRKRDCSHRRLLRRLTEDRVEATEPVVKL